jgi:hypothetical protein
MRMRWMLVSLLLLAAPAPGALSQVIDQMQPLVDGTVGGLAIGGTSHQKLSQVVTARLAGDISAFFLPVACTSGKLTVEIRDVAGDEPGSVVLLRRRIPAAELANVGLAFRRIALGAVIHLSAGDRFALVLSNSLGECGIFQGPSGDSYAGGALFFDALPNAPGWIPVFAPTRDLPFLEVLALP